MSRLFDNELNRDPMDAYYEIQELKAENERLRGALTELYAVHLMWEGSEHWDMQDHTVSRGVAALLNGEVLPSEESAGAATDETNPDLPF